MLNALLLCWGMLQGGRAMLISDPSSDYTEEMSSNLNEMGTYNYPIGKAKVASLALPGSLGRQELARIAAQSDEDANGDYSLLNPRVLSYSLEAAGREERSPKRCAQLLDLCMGDVPCCNPCATCHCRFYKVYCYCRKISHNCHLSKN
ncbi:agouti-related protein [Ambystoma mexicanum]|uniref:agouti-related protein n=1 Tax=Ambystoma mexicanum TaxID=8296 RepID=UPI0037E99CA8